MLFSTPVWQIPFLRHRGKLTTRTPDNLLYIMSRPVWHGVGLILNLPYTRNRPGVDEIRGILVHQQHDQSGVVNKPKNALFTTPVSKVPHLGHRGTFTPHMPDRPHAVTARISWCRGILEAILLSLNPSCTRNGPVLDMTRRIGVRRQRLRTDVENRIIISDTGAANTLFTITRHVRVTDPESARRRTASLAWCRAPIEAIIYRKRSSARRDTYVIAACAPTAA